MAESSSAGTTFRALVMLVSAVLIPAAAICGTSYPGVLKAIQAGRWPALADFRSPGDKPLTSFGGSAKPRGTRRL